MSKPWLKRILQIVGTLALVALLIAVYRRTDRSKGFTPDGDLALVAAAIAFIAVIIQIRSSSKQVQEQIKAQRDAEREERERQRRANATALLYEIESFYTVELELTEKELAGWDPASNDLPTWFALRTNTSEIYKGVSPLLGSLNAKSVSAIVRFYSAVGRYEGHRHNYQYMSGMAWSPAGRAVDRQNAANQAKAQLKMIRELIPHLKSLAGNISQRVAHDCGLDELIAKEDAKKN